MTVMLEGRYTDAYLAEAGGETPKFTDEELSTLRLAWQDRPVGIRSGRR
jgi:hypothetical protein